MRNSRSTASWWRQRGAVLLSVGLAAAHVVGFPNPPVAHALVLTDAVRASVAFDGAEGDGDSTEAAISDDGRIVAFRSFATNLVPGDTNARTDVFVRDNESGVVTRVSVRSDGTQGNGTSETPAISGDGRFVAFQSEATNLTPTSSSGTARVFVHDRVTGTTELVAVNTNGSPMGATGSPSLSQDGRVVSFVTVATGHVYVRDRAAGITTHVTPGANDASSGARLSADGRHLVFTASATNLVAGDTNGFPDVFAYRLDTGTTERLSVPTGGVQATGGASDRPSVSGDGTLVTFASGAVDLVAGDTNQVQDVFVRDRLTGETRRVSVGPGGVQGNEGSGWPSVSNDGRFVAFRSVAVTLVPGFTTRRDVVYVRDLERDVTAAASQSTTGATPNGSSAPPDISATGRRIAFASVASDLVAGDGNARSDVFVAHVDTGRPFDPTESELRGSRPSLGYAEDPVNTATGNYVESALDLDFPASTAGMEWSRTYNARSADIGALGRGWTHVYESRISEDALGNVSLVDHDGRLVRFARTTTGAFVRPVEFRATLSEQADGTFRLAWDDGRTDVFDGAGRLASRTYWDGQAVTLTWSGGELTSVSSSTGRSLAFAYSGGRLATATAGDGRVISYAYDADGDLASVTTTDGGTTTYATDGSGRITSVTDPDGKAVVANAYDAAGRVASQTTPSGDTVTFSYNDVTGTTTVSRALSASSVVYAHDRQGRLVSVTDPHGEVLTKTWDDSGNLASVVDRRDGGVTSTFDSRGNVLTRTEPEGVSTSFAWDASDRLTSATNGEAETTTFSYDGSERVPSTVTDAEGGMTTYDVVAGVVESVTDADGVTLDLAWNAKRELVSVTDEDGGTTASAYDAAGNRTSAGTPLGHTTVWSYDGRRRVTSSTDAEGAIESWQWSVGGRLTKRTDAEAHETTFVYDTAGRLASVTDALGGVTTYGYDLDGNATSVTRPGSSTSTATYDPLGRRLSDTDPTGVATTYGYDADGNLTSVTDEAGKAETRAWDLRGRLTTATDRLGKSTTYTWDDADRLASTTDPLGGVTAYAYDDAGRVLSRTAPDGGVWQRAWTPAGRLDTETDPNGHVVDLAWDDVGRLDTVTDALGHVTDLAWDADARLTSRTTPEGLVTAFAYDDVGRVTSTTSPAGGVTATTWTPRGQTATEVRPASGVRSFAYDALGRLTTATDANGEDTDWTWDARGNPLTRTDAKGGVTAWTWDAADRMVTATDPLARTTARTYDTLGRPATVADPSGRSVAFAYDDAWRITSLTYGDGSVVSYGWDDAGRRTSLTDTTGTTTFGWDAVGRMTSVAYPTGASLGFEWDDAGNRTGLEYPDATAATFTWDAADRLTGIAHPHAAGGVAYSYDDDGRLLTETLPGSVSRTYGWDDGRLASYAESRPEGTRTTTLTHDAADRVVSETTNGAATSYDYDDAGQLVGVTRGSASTAYGYDAVGNRTTKQQGPALTSYAYDVAHQLASATRTVGGVSAGTVSAAHDQAGRLTSLTGATGMRTLSYDARGALASLSTSRPTLGVVSTTSRTVDGDGVLQAATTTAPVGSQSTAFTWDPSAAVPEVATTTSGGVDVNHLYGMGRALALRGGQSDSYAQDARGSTLAIGEAQDLARAPDYDEFGVAVAGSPAADLLDEMMGLTAGHADATPSFGYRGEMHLDGMVHLRAREYAPGLGRFTTVDPLDGIAGEVTVANPYPYAANEPVNLIDPLGLRPLSDAELRRQIAVYHYMYSPSLRLLGAFLEANKWKILIGAAGIAALTLLFDACVVFSTGACGLVAAAGNSPADEAASVRITTDVLQEFLKRSGFDRAAEFARSFSGQITARIAQPGESFVRYTGHAGSTGHFLTRGSFANSAQATKALNLLPEFGNNATLVQNVVVTRPTLVFEGGIRGGTAVQTLLTDVGAFIFERGVPY